MCIRDSSSAINDGAAALVVMSEEKAKELGVEPEVMGLGPIAATKKVMAKTGLTVDDMDLIEANEAFAAQSVACLLYTSNLGGQC